MITAVASGKGGTGKTTVLGSFAALALVIAEPTPSGLHDLGRVLQLPAHFRAPTAISVNKWDINPDLTRGIERFARDVGAAPLARIPLDDDVGEATAEAVPLVEWNQGAAAKAFRALWDDVASWRAL